MEALTISAANLSTIENNLNEVAKELGGVMLNVNDVNAHMNTVEDKVNNLNDEIKKLVDDIKSTTIVTNARQNIMYNNSIIEKKFGYFDNVRRTTESLLEILEYPNLSRDSLLKLRENIILSNPNYWLANCLSCLASWVLNDKQTADEQLAKALSKDDEKTSLFFCLVNLKIGRTNTSINWLNRYLSIEDPTKLDPDFITILDLVSTGAFGNAEKEIVLNKIYGWFKDLNAIKSVESKNLETWQHFISDFNTYEFDFPYLENLSSDHQVAINNLGITSTYEPLKNHLNDIINKEQSPKRIDDIISDLIYKYEKQENSYQKDNLKNNLIINNNGDLEAANKEYNKEVTIYDEEVDLVSLLSNIIIYKDAYEVSNETQKIALSLCKDYILKALEKNNTNIKQLDINYSIDDFITHSKDGTNYEEVEKSLNNYLDSKYDGEDKASIITLIAINIIGIIGIFLTMNHQILFGILLIILIAGNIALFYKMFKKRKTNLELKNNIKTIYKNQIDNVMAEILDYNQMMITSNEHFEDLKSYLINLKAEDYITSNNERNIKIGE